MNQSARQPATKHLASIEQSKLYEEEDSADFND